MTCPTMHAFNMRAQVVAVLCGSWNCPTCARENARMWAWRCKLHVKERGNHAYFWTLTLRGKFRTATAGYLALPGLWDRLRKRLKRAGVTRWSYCAFVEGQPERGYMPHFHIISMTRCPIRLKDLAMASGFGYQADEKTINSNRASSYCAKYASKQNPKTPRGFRRVRASRDWTKLPDTDFPAIIVKSKTEQVHEYLIRVADLTGADLQSIADAWLDIGEAL